MKYARLFRENKFVQVSAQDVKDGLYRRDEEFVDLEYNFKVQYVCGSRNHGGPYFRLYYSREEYRRLFPEHADRYEIVKNMRSYQESSWHREWKEKFSDFCVIEKCVRDPGHSVWRFSDAFCEEYKISIEFQNSYIDHDFEDRNNFYSSLGIKTVWLYNLPKANAKVSGDGAIEILEDNARGFFRIAECTENLKNNYVYIQVKSKKIYRVKELLRRSSGCDLKSTIRYFFPCEEYSETEFIDAVKNNRIDNGWEKPTEASSEPQTLEQLWRAEYSWVKVKNIVKNDVRIISHNGNGAMFRSFLNDCVQYKYDDEKTACIPLKKRPAYSISHKDEKAPI